MVDHVHAGSGLQSFTVVNATNATVSIPVFTPGTYNPVTATFSIINLNQGVDITLRATNQFHGLLIRLQCDFVAPTPTPTITPTPTPGTSGRVKGGFGVKEIDFNHSGNYANPYEDVRIRVS